MSSIPNTLQISLNEKFSKTLPGIFFLDAEDITGLSQYLQRQHFLNDGEIIAQLERAGDSNMNLVLRATTSSRSFIIKQARPWVEKYPHIEAPLDRILREALYYEITNIDATLQTFHPAILFYDPASFLIIMEDLGKVADFMSLYQGKTELNTEHIVQLSNYLSQLHDQFGNQGFKRAVPNYRMRILNAEHIFEFPFKKDNGFDLDKIQPGLSQFAFTFKNDRALLKCKEKLMDLYLGDEHLCLLHGDFYPGSWLNVSGRIKIIDPEFCFTGPAEFDTGIFIAHLLMANQPKKLIDVVFSNSKTSDDFNFELMLNFTGIEILRRILGLAQLPLVLAFEQRKALLLQARELVVSPKENTLWRRIHE